MFLQRRAGIGIINAVPPQQGWPMSLPPDQRPNYYAALPLDRRAQQRGDQAWIDRLMRDSATRILPVWRAQSLVAGIGEAPRAAWLSMTQAEAWIGGTHAVFLGIAGE